MAKHWTLFYLLTAMVWLYRSSRAFRSLREIPRPRVSPPLPHALKVSILLPVKNEEVNLEDCLNTLRAQDYPAKEIIVINDNSVDRTGEILSKALRLYPNLLQSVNAPPVPEGWTGKNWALHQGVPRARGEWFLFTDADTRHEPGALSSALAHAEARDLDLLTLTPRCLAVGFWEKTLQPAAMGFLGLWFPLNKVNRPDSTTVFGNGQFLLIRRKIYEKLGGHEKVKGEFLEDFAFVKAAKAARFRVECAFGQDLYGTRMYRSFLGIWLGWRRIFLHAFQKNPFLLLGRTLVVFCFSVLPFFLFPFLTQAALKRPDLHGQIWGAAFLILGLILFTVWKTHNIVGAPRKYSLLHPLAGFVLTGILTDALLAAQQKKKLKWR